MRVDRLLCIALSFLLFSIVTQCRSRLATCNPQVVFSSLAFSIMAPSALPRWAASSARNFTETLELTTSSGDG